MSESIESLFGRALWFLVGTSVLLAVVMLVLVQARLAVDLGMRLYWRLKTSISELRSDTAAWPAAEAAPDRREDD